ncbi:ParB/RepB/Spo0J family partition protein, partial [Patescibacteria group bacterium]|nr:ParB/RepB/Spo0J family partition protein [Patescibacteria group bacterium]
MREYLEMEIPGRGLVRADRNPETWPNRDGGCGFVPHWALVADPDQPRTYFDPDELAELGESIKTEGQREILTVDLLTDVERELYAQKNAVPRYILVSGERRWRASGPGYADLPLVEIRLRRYENPDDRHLDAVLLNESRVDLAPLDRARQYARLLEGRCRGNKSLLCKMIGRSPPDVDGYLSLNNLSPLAKDAMHPSRKKEALKYGTALVLAKLHASLQDNFVPRIMAGEAGRTSTEQRRWIAIQLVNRGGP